MRISTAQMFQQNSYSIAKGQSETSKTLLQLATGKKINTAGDDPVAAIGIDKLNQQNNLVDQYLRNIDYGENHLNQTETLLGDLDNLAGSMKEQLLRGSNGSMTDNERQTIADEMQKTLDQMLAIANKKDESGNYLFAGNKTGSAPFEFDANGQIIYNGDSGTRESIIASGVLTDTNMPGDAVFMNALNAMGDYSANYMAGQQGEFSVDSAKITDSAAHIADTYQFAFIDNGAGGVDVEVRDSANNVLTTVADFDSSMPIKINGMEVKLDGEPMAGDSFTLEPMAEVSILDSFSQAISLLQSGDKIQTPQGKAELAQLLNNIDSGVNQMSAKRGEVGNSLKVMDQYKSNHTDEKVINASALSMLEDLDYAEAIIEFEKQQLALNAVSSVFSKVGSTSLFDYI
ncbi:MULTISPECIES: flagellar hook-associated protein FlgL [unclassified Shewanella]|uniref:flagellar hook-associated protein FlgL n=1 Tax=unclassified Shewanella TaxID=196818 RepID=UPI000C81AC69|nr:MULTISPECIES: flagellar hook-associated protein FlgL [unclassified Shewanella]PMH86228.1 flagellar hook-associated protein 3 [Shewanella sp. 10N.286.48.B5]PMI01270.1 flagellar hook-associated protein 3 [Shewanella sp. 10N.286.48.A6]